MYALLGPCTKRARGDCTVHKSLFVRFQEYDSGDETGWISKDDVPHISTDDVGRLQATEALMADQTFRWQGYLDQKTAGMKLHQELRGKLITTTVLWPDAVVCGQLEHWLRATFRREVVDVSLVA